jgi:hypothetical protein
VLEPREQARRALAHVADELARVALELLAQDVLRRLPFGRRLGGLRLARIVLALARVELREQLEAADPVGGRVVHLEQHRGAAVRQALE